MSVEFVGEAKRRYEVLLLAKKNVVAVGIDYQEVGGTQDRRISHCCFCCSEGSLGGTLGGGYPTQGGRRGEDGCSGERDDPSFAGPHR